MSDDEMSDDDKSKGEPYQQSLAGVDEIGLI